MVQRPSQEGERAAGCTRICVLCAHRQPTNRNRSSVWSESRTVGREKVLERSERRIVLKSLYAGEADMECALQCGLP
jgi:hypothetical protein